MNENTFADFYGAKILFKVDSQLNQYLGTLKSSLGFIWVEHLHSYST